jgi:Zn-dependent protease
VFAIGTLSLAFGLQSAIIAGIILFLSVVAHESAHAITSVLSGVEVKAVRCSAIGPHIVRAKSDSAYVELAVAAAGPFANLLLGLLLWPVYAPMAGWASLSNLALAMINLLPLKHSDGAKMLAALAAIVHNDKA